MKQTKIKCDFCDDELNEDESFCMVTLLEPLEEDKHFCDKECLKKWIIK